MRPVPTIVLATLADVPAIHALQRASMAHLGRAHYGARELESAVEYVCRPDLTLIEDGTYFLARLPDEGNMLAGCGGWSFRRKTFAGPAEATGDGDRLEPGRDAAKIRAMFVAPECARRGVGAAILAHCEAAAREAGFTSAELGATLSGEHFYRRFGYVERERVASPMADGTPLTVVMMAKQL